MTHSKRSLYLTIVWSVSVAVPLVLMFTTPVRILVTLMLVTPIAVALDVDGLVVLSLLFLVFVLAIRIFLGFLLRRSITISNLVN